MRAGRKRSTPCPNDHYPNTVCKNCARLRAKAFRARQRGKKRPALDVESDVEAQAHRAQESRARAYVHRYLQRGAIIPPSDCDLCCRRTLGLGAWHPDPEKKREVAWLCESCRRHVRATREELTLRWVWPGGMEVPISASAQTSWIETARRCAYRIERAFGTAGAITFVQTFEAEAGAAAAATCREALRAIKRTQTWQATHDPRLDLLLTEWAKLYRVPADPEHERSCTPVDRWERRQRKDRPMKQETFDRKPAQPFDKAAQEKRMEAALSNLSSAMDAVDALLMRLEPRG